jgi:transposase
LVGSLLLDNSPSREATDWREGRRLRTFELKQEEWSQQRIAEAHGFRGEVWTCERVAEVIRKGFGGGYQRAHVSRLLKTFKQSLQKPQRRANQRDEETIEHWKEERWPRLKKGH